VEPDLVVSVPAGTFTTTPVRQTSPLNASSSVNYWSSSVGFWVPASFTNDTGQEENRMELSSFRYQGPGWLGYLTMSFFGFPLMIWLILLLVVIVAIVTVAAARRRKRRRRIPAQQYDPSSSWNSPPGSQP